MSDVSSVTTTVKTEDPPKTVTVTEPVLIPRQPDHRSFLGSLFSSDDKRADSLIMACFVSLIVDALFQAWQMAAAGATLFSPLNFGGSLATIIGAFGIARGAREYMKPDGDH